jgi:transposase-like protein
MKKQKHVKICPKCKSFDIQVYSFTMMAAGLPPSYTCKKCGYTSNLFPEIDLNEERDKDNNKRKK